MSNPTQSERGTFKTPDGIDIHWASDVPEGAKAAVMLLHGYAEHLGRYDGFVESLNARGFAVWRLDYRGHGRSGGRRGHVYHFDDFFAELGLVRDRMFAATERLPRFLVGHSHGGLLSTHFISRSPEGFRGVALSSPFFGFGLKVPAWKAFAGRTLSRLVPALAMPTDIDPAIVSHDPEVVRQYKSDPLNGRTATARWFTEMLRVHSETPAAAHRVKLPILVQQAGDDRLAAVESTRQIFAALGSEDRQYIEYPGMYHEIWFEQERARTVGDLLEWLDKHT